MSRRALSRTDGRSSCRFTSGEKRTTAATGNCSGTTSAATSVVTSPPPLESPAIDDPLGVDAVRQQPVQDGDGILEVGRERELGGEAQVGEEDVAPGATGQPRREYAVHPGRRPHVASTVEVDDGAPRPPVAGADPLPQDATDCAVLVVPAPGS